MRVRTHRPAAPTTPNASPSSRHRLAPRPNCPATSRGTASTAAPATRPAHGAGVLRGKGPLDLCLSLITPRQARYRARPGSRAPIANAWSHRIAPWPTPSGSGQTDRAAVHWTPALAILRARPSQGSAPLCSYKTPTPPRQPRDARTRPLRPPHPPDAASCRSAPSGSPASRSEAAWPR